MANPTADLHSHILPGIDDGAKTVEESLNLLRAEKKQGVDAVVFTPHYNSKRSSISEFVKKRDESLESLVSTKEFQELGLSYNVGSEVYFSVSLLNEDVDPLCFKGTDYILVELPFEFKPHGLVNTFENLLSRGYIPIIAHVERYAYFSKDPTILYDLVERGCLAHINASTLLSNSKLRSLSLKYIKWGLVQFLCSDCHSIKHRPPNIAEGIAVVKKALGAEYGDNLSANSGKIFCGKSVETADIIKPRSFFGKWI